MTASEIFKLFKKVEESSKERYLINIENTGYIEFSKNDILDKLHFEYCSARLGEHYIWLKSKKVKHRDIAREMGINKEAFSLLLSGRIRSNKKVGDSLEFITKSKQIAEKLC